jgi:ABC-type glutathione transport system ATPase component
MESSERTTLLVITGSMGSGKSTVLAEASDILAARGIFHAAIDLDALGSVHVCSDTDKRNVVDRNLRCVWENFASLGITRLLLARAIETREELEGCCTAVGSGKAVVCRLTAGLETMRQRVRGREIGMMQQEFVDRVAVLDTLLDDARLEDFTVANENRALTDVAREVLLRAGWIAERPATEDSGGLGS